MSCNIPLGQGRVALVDPADYDRFHHHDWFYSKTGYAVGYVPVDGRYTLTYLHRLILQPGQDEQVDHLNGDPLDCRRANLRLATPSQNGQNRRVSPLSETRLKGVGWHKGRGRYHARIQLEGTRVHLGFFDDPETAALAYDAAARLLFGAFAVCNYPEQATPPLVALLVMERLQRRGLLLDWPALARTVAAAVAAAG
jgi:hypothetical protein